MAVKVSTKDPKNSGRSCLLLVLGSDRQHRKSYYLFMCLCDVYVCLTFAEWSLRLLRTALTRHSSAYLPFVLINPLFCQCITPMWKGFRLFVVATAALFWEQKMGLMYSLLLMMFQTPYNLTNECTEDWVSLVSLPICLTSNGNLNSQVHLINNLSNLIVLVSVTAQCCQSLSATYPLCWKPTLYQQKEAKLVSTDK